MMNISVRGRGLLSDNEEIQRPGSATEEKYASPVEDLVARIIAVTSPDDLDITNLANEIMVSINEENDLSDLINQLYENGLKHRELTPVIAAVCGLAAQHQVGQTKLRPLLLKKLQSNYEKREELETADRMQFITASLMLGEVYHRVKNANGLHIEVLVLPVVTSLMLILKPHLSSDPGPDVNEEMLVVAKQLLQSGHVLFKFEPEGVVDIVSGVTEVVVRHQSSLSNVCLLNLLASLADLWPDVQTIRSPRTTHATLAAKLGLSLNI